MPGRANHLIVAMPLAKGDKGTKSGRTVYLVDEATMISVHQTDALFAHRTKGGARLVLVGDFDQLGSIGAGRAFAQLLDHEMKTVVLDQVVRQTNDHTREAVEAMLAGEPARAFDAIDKGAGASSSIPRTISAARSSRGISQHFPARNAPQHSCSTRPASRMAAAHRKR